MSDLALPPHLRGRKHNDWLLFNWISRGYNAYGPRVSKQAKDYRPWPPKLVEGKGIARWESSNAQSIIFIPELVGRNVKGSDIYGRTFGAIEMKLGHPHFMEHRAVEIPHWREAKVTDIFDPMNPNNFQTVITPNQYSPSALQKFSYKGWMRLDPDYFTKWSVIKKKELPIWPETGEDRVLFMREGFRPDHLDSYYNKSLLLTAGLHWE